MMAQLLDVNYHGMNGLGIEALKARLPISQLTPTLWYTGGFNI